MANRILLGAIKIDLSQPSTPSVYVGVPTGKPFIVHPETYASAATCQWGNESYLLSNEIHKQYLNQLKYVSKSHLYRGKFIDSGDEFLLIVKEPWPNYPTAGFDSLDAAVSDAQSKGAITLQYINKEKGYRRSLQKIDRRRSKWSDLDLESLINAAFPDELYVDTEDHALLDEIYIGPTEESSHSIVDELEAGADYAFD